MTTNRPAIENYLMDMDGVLVHEERLIPGADLFVKRLQQTGHRFLLLTNNSIYTARDLAASGADVLALVELTPPATGTYEKELAKAYPYHALQGTVGLWSKLPLSGTQPVDVMDYGPLAATRPAGATMAPDRALAGLTAQLRSAQDVAGNGFGFTWPASFPVLRIDQILVRGVEPDNSWVRPANGSDHRPVAATISW